MKECWNSPFRLNPESTTDPEAQRIDYPIKLHTCHCTLVRPSWHPMASAGRRERPKASLGPHSKSEISKNAIPLQELSDFRAIISSLEHHDTSQIRTELSDDARNRRGMNEAVERAAASLNDSSVNKDWKEGLQKNAYKMLRRHSQLLWPLPCHDVPAPPELLSDEIATSAEKIAPIKEGKDCLSNLTSIEHGQIWMAIQSALYYVLSLLAWTFPSHLPTSSLQKEVERLLANAKGYKPEAIRSVLSYYNWNIDRLSRSHTITWRDVLAVSLGSDNPVLIRAAEKALVLLQELYNAQPEEPKLEKRTWSLHSNAPLHERSRILQKVRQYCPSYCLMDYINESIYSDHILSPFNNETPTVPKGNDMLLSDSREQSWLSDVDELYASLMWDGDSDDMSSMPDIDEIPSDPPYPDESVQSSDSGSESEGGDGDSETSDDELSSTSSSSSSESSADSDESESETDSEDPEAQSSNTRKRQNALPLPGPKRARTKG